MMTQQFDATAKQIATGIIDLSLMLDSELETWSDADKRPDDMSPTECVGFINKEADTEGMNIVVDLQAPNDDAQAVLRTWAIDSHLDNNEVERFDNIQLEFDVDYDQARAVAQKGNQVSRDDLQTLINQPTTSLAHVVVSDRSGHNSSTNELLGERFDLEASDVDQQDDLAHKISDTLSAVLVRLKESAAH